MDGRRDDRGEDVVAAFAARVRRERLRRGWTLEHAAEVCAVEVRHLQAIEAGDANVTLRTLDRLEGGLGPLREAVVDPAPRWQEIATQTSAEDWTCVGAHVATFRIARGWTQHQLAAESALSLSVIQSIERAQKSPTLRSVFAVANALAVPAAMLVVPVGDGLRAQGSRPRVRKRT